MDTKPSIFDYMDYRAFLSDSLSCVKKHSPQYSYRFIAQRLGLSSPGYFLYVIQGKRNLSEELALKTAQMFKLGKKETEHLLLLMNYAHSKSHLEKQFLFERINLIRKRKNKAVSPAHYSYFEKWYHLAIREYVAINRFTDEFEMLARSLRPAITSQQAKEAIETLENTGMIRKNNQGWYERVDSIVTTGDIWESAVIRNLQHQLIDLSKETLESCPKHLRDFSNCTISISPETFAAIREKIAALRGEILEMAKNDPNPASIYQLNIQAFPLYYGAGEQGP